MGGGSGGVRGGSWREQKNPLLGLVFGPFVTSFLFYIPNLPFSNFNEDFLLFFSFLYNVAASFIMESNRKLSFFMNIAVMRNIFHFERDALVGRVGCDKVQ